MLCLNTITSMIKTNTFFDFTDFQPPMPHDPSTTAVKERAPIHKATCGLWVVCCTNWLSGSICFGTRSGPGFTCVWPAVVRWVRTNPLLFFYYFVLVLTNTFGPCKVQLDSLKYFHVFSKKKTICQVSSPTFFFFFLTNTCGLCKVTVNLIGIFPRFVFPKIFFQKYTAIDFRPCPGWIVDLRRRWATGAWSIHDTCWWYSLCNLEYWSK